MSATTWPPLATRDTVWREASLLVRDRGYHSTQLVRAREVRLWGRTVLIDAAGDVHCPECQRFIPVVELGRPDNTHSVGIRVPAGTVVAIAGYGPPPAEPVSGKSAT